MGANMSAPETVSGVTTAWSPLTTTFTYRPRCSDYLRWNYHSFVAFDPGYGSDIDADAATCLPPQVTSWWDASKIPGNTHLTSIGPLVCPQHYRTLKTSVNPGSSTHVLCCPSGYSLAQPSDTGFDVGCESDAKAGMVLTYAATSQGQSLWWTSSTTLAAATAISAVPIPGWIYPGFVTSPDVAPMTTGKKDDGKQVSTTSQIAAVETPLSSSSSTTSASNMSEQDGAIVLKSNGDGENGAESKAGIDTTSTSTDPKTTDSAATSSSSVDATEASSTSSTITTTNEAGGLTSLVLTSTSSITKPPTSTKSTSKPSHTTTTATAQSSDNTQLSTQSKLGIGIGTSCGAAALLLAGVFGCLWCRRRRRARTKRTMRISEGSMHPNGYFAAHLGSAARLTLRESSNNAWQNDYGARPPSTVVLAGSVHHESAAFDEIGGYYAEDADKFLATENAMSHGDERQSPALLAWNPHSLAWNLRSLLGSLSSRARKTPHIANPAPWDIGSAPPPTQQPSMRQYAPCTTPATSVYTSELPQSPPFAVKPAGQRILSLSRRIDSLYELPSDESDVEEKKTGWEHVFEKGDDDVASGLEEMPLPSAIRPAATIHSAPIDEASTRAASIPPIRQMRSPQSSATHHNSFSSKQFDFLDQDPMGPPPQNSLSTSSQHGKKTSLNGSRAVASWSSSDPDLETDDSTISGWTVPYEVDRDPAGGGRRPTWSFRGLRNGSAAMARHLSRSTSNGSSSWGR